MNQERDFQKVHKFSVLNQEEDFPTFIQSNASESSALDSDAFLTRWIPTRLDFDEGRHANFMNVSELSELVQKGATTRQQRVRVVYRSDASVDSLLTRC